MYSPICNFFATVTRRNIKTMINPLISYFNNGITDIYKPYTVSIEKLHSGITSCEKWIEPTKKTREAYLKYGKTAPYKAIRNKLPYVTPDGVWSDRSKTASSRLITPSNLIQIDIDGLNAEELETTRRIMITDPHTLILFTSPSGAGLKSFVKCENFSSLVKGSLIEYYRQLGIVLDETTLHDKAACFVCHDSSAYLNLEAEPFIIKTAPAQEREVVKPLIVSATCSTVAEAAAFCRAAIEKRAMQLAEAPKHTGTDTLNLCAFLLGMFDGAGLSREAAEDALRQAYLNRPFQRHSESEFIKVFNSGWEAGKQKPLSIDKPSQFAKAAK
jgi:hypothetical protein